MTQQALNFLWISLDFSAADFSLSKRSNDQSIKCPMPDDYIESILKAGKNNPETKVRLWIDSKRLTEDQKLYLDNVFSDKSSGNTFVCDLRDIPEYKKISCLTMESTLLIGVIRKKIL